MDFRKCAVQDAFDVRVDHGIPVVEREAGDRVRGVGADAHQVGQVLRRLGELAVVLLYDLPGGLVQVLRPVVVPQRVVRPEPHHVGAVGGSEVGDRRPAIHERLPGVHDAFELCLLAHHLRDEDGVRVGGLAPRERSVIGLVPRDQRVPEGVDVVREVPPGLGGAGIPHRTGIPGVFAWVWRFATARTSGPG